MRRTTVALAHDYLTQRGGAERVASVLVRAFPQAPLHTTLFEPTSTFPEFATVDVRPSALNGVGVLRRHHRLALPVLAPAISTMRIDADVVVCSSSGWSHGIRTTGRKVVYCHNTARWLYQERQYLGDDRGVARTALTSLRRPLRSWDVRAASSAHRYLANSTATKERIRRAYGIDAEVVHPPPAIEPDGPARQPADLDAGFALCIARLRPYKNIDVAIAAMEVLPTEQLVVVGDGPDLERLRSIAGPNVRFLGSVSDVELRWLYDRCACLVTPSHEDFGLTPLEAASFGKPTAALRWGGFLDTVRDGETGVFFDAPEPSAVAAALREIFRREWDPRALVAHATPFKEEHFMARMQAIVEEELALTR